MAKATKSAQRAAPKDKTITMTSVVRDNMEDAIAHVTGNGTTHHFNPSQLLYFLRPIVKTETGKTLTTNHFNAIMTDYENEYGDIPGMYHEPRGTLYHPHLHEYISLGTQMVEECERPIWTFNKLLYIEKEGFTPALVEMQWPERHDCAVFSSKGYTTRAVKDLTDKLAEHDEPVEVFTVHDADAFGTMIHQTFQEATKARAHARSRSSISDWSRGKLSRWDFRWRMPMTNRDWAKRNGAKQLLNMCATATTTLPMVTVGKNGCRPTASS